MLCVGPLRGGGIFFIRRTGFDIYYLIVVLLYINLAQQLLKESDPGSIPGHATNFPNFSNFSEGIGKPL